MLNGKTAQGRPGLFVFAKTATAISARHPALREALIQASLDPQVRPIAYIPWAGVASELELDAVIVQRDGGRFHLDVVLARRVRSRDDECLASIALDDLGLKPLTLTAPELRREPRHANLAWSDPTTGSRSRWPAHAHPAGARGPRFRSGSCSRSIRADGNPTAGAMAFACAHLLTLDLASQQLGPSTIVRSRS